jgi:hypothetical protein
MHWEIVEELHFVAAELAMVDSARTDSEEQLLGIR